MQTGQVWQEYEIHSSEVGEVVGQVAVVAGGLFTVLSRLQALLSKADEKPYQARLLEARINSCKALLGCLDSRVDGAHLEPLRIKLSHIEEMVERAGKRFHVSKFTDESLARNFEQASAVLAEEETHLALVVRALPPTTKAKGTRGRSNSGSRRHSRRHSSRSFSGSRTRGGRSASPGFDGLSDYALPLPPGGRGTSFGSELDGVSENGSFSLPQTGMRPLEEVRDEPEAEGYELEKAQLSIRVRSADESPTTRSPASMAACLAQYANGYDRATSGPLVPSATVRRAEGYEEPHSFSPREVEKSSGPVVRIGVSPASPTASAGLELPLPVIQMVETAIGTFWQDSVTLVFCCAVSGHQHRVKTQQWKQWSAWPSERLVSWVGKPAWSGICWQQEMEEGSLSSIAQAELKELLLQSGWYDKFRFDASCGFKGAWVIKEVASAGYQPCDED